MLKLHIKGAKRGEGVIILIKPNKLRNENSVLTSKNVIYLQIMQVFYLFY